ncbi:hypothetical protein CR513_17385, partial [Mucuna pruriens]
MQKILCVSIVGSLMYAQVCTHPDIAFVVEVLGKYLSDLGMQHLKANRETNVPRGIKEYKESEGRKL